MLMRKVNSDEKQKLISFYKRVCREIGSDHTPYWEVGVYPTYQDLENDVDEGRAYGYFEEDDLLGAAIISRGEDPAYVSHENCCSISVLYWKRKTLFKVLFCLAAITDVSLRLSVRTSWLKMGLPVHRSILITE